MAAMRTRYPAGISKNTVLLAFASLFADISSEMLYPILPIFLTQVLHASGSVVGVVEGVAEATQNVVQGFSGWLSDKLQKRKVPALIGYLVSALGKPLMGIATAWPGVLGGRFLDRLGAGFRSAPRDALIASSVPDEYRGRAFGLEGIGDNLGAFLGPLLAVLLFLSFHFEIRWIFFVAIVPGLLAFLMVLFVHERPVPVTAKSKIDLSLREFPVGYWKYLLVIAIFEIGNSSNSFLILQTKNIGASFVVTILIYAGFNLMAALISYPAGSLSDRWGRRNILLASFVIFFVAYLGFATARSVAAIAVLFVFYGCFREYFGRSEKHLLPISCQSPCAQVPSAGTVLSSDFWDWSQALSLACCGTTSVTPLCFITVRFLRLRAASDCSLFQGNAIGPPLTPEAWAATW